MSGSNKVEDLKLTQDELSRLTKALKNEEFRKLLADYAEEISDPVNKAKYEEEIAMLENERGMDVKFIHPNPGHVIKTNITEGNLKAFFNICKNEHIDEARCSKQPGKSGLHWSIPHSFAPVRDDFDKKGEKCKVFDFVVHPNTYRMAETNERFKNMIHETAIDSAQKQFGLNFDKKHIHKPKMKFKGTPTATVVRSRKEGTESNFDSDDLLSKVPYPYDDKTSEEKAKDQAEKVAKVKATEKQQELDKKVTDDDYNIPVYIIKHRNNVDLQQFTNSRDSRMSMRPSDIIVEIDLPQIKSAASVDLDIFEKELKLKSEVPVKYQLDLTLPYEVNENEGSAKFDKGKHKLIITLPVVPGKMDKASVNNDENTETNYEGEAPEENGLSEQTPLIEILSSDEIQQRGDVDFDLNKDDTGSLRTDLETEKTDADHEQNEASSPRIFYMCPPFSHHQDDETITIIIGVKNVSRESVVKQFIKIDNCFSFEIKMVSVGPGGFPMNYKLFTKFPDACLIDEQESYISMNDENVVATLAKSNSCLGLWEKFNAGLDADTTQEVAFLTQHNVKLKLDQLDQDLNDYRENVNKDDQLDLEVTDMNSKCLSVDIKEKQGAGHSFSESAEEIEVVHDRLRPKIPSILKQRSRTMSESSDDIFAGSLGRQYSTGGETSPTTVTEESENENSDSQNGERKKSVSFSEHIDQTLYKTSQSVSSMRSTLKNKRKKAQRKEKKQASKEKKQQRKRQNSNSEPSSDELSGSYHDSDPSEELPESRTLLEGNRHDEDPIFNSNEVETKENSKDKSHRKNKHSEEEISNNVCDISNDVTSPESVQNARLEENVDSDDGEENGDNELNNIEKPDTVLSWEDKPPVMNGDTKSAFDFSNSLMYELDVD